MLVSDNEFGAPWNDRQYRIKYETLNGEVTEDILTLDGPKQYSYWEIHDWAMKMFNPKKIIAICDL
jgi:hypothetical protein